MENLEKDIEVLNSALKGKYSIDYLLNLYKSNKDDTFILSKKVIYIFLLIGIALFIFGLYNYQFITSIIGFLIFGYYGYYLGNIKGYKIGAIEGIHDGFKSGSLNIQLDLLKFLLKYKNKKYDEPEKATMNILSLSLDNEFSFFNNIGKNENNNDLIDFELNKIISRESEYYYDMGFKK